MIPGLGRSPGEGTGYPLQYSGLENFILHLFRYGFSCFNGGQNNRDFNEGEGSYFLKSEQAGRSGAEQHCSFTSTPAPGLLVHRVKGDSHPLYDCVSANKKEEKSEDTSPGFKGVTSELGTLLSLRVCFIVLPDLGNKNKDNQLNLNVR